jgi:hypothetical protein
VRSVGAVLAGLATLFATSTATDLALHAAGVYPPSARRCDTLFALASVYASSTAVKQRRARLR